MQLTMFCNSPVSQADIRTGPTGCKAPRLLQIYKHLNWAGQSVYTVSGDIVLLPETNYKNATSLFKKKKESITFTKNTPFRNQVIFKKI
jgi:hypothetical protein